MFKKLSKMDEISLLLNTIFLNYFNNTYCVFLVIDRQIELEILNIPIVIFNISEKNNLTSSEERKINFNHHCQGFIIFSNTPNDVFDDIERNMYFDRESPFKFNNRKYIFLLNEEINQSFFNESTYLDKVPNVIFIVKDFDDNALEDTVKWKLESVELNYTIFTHSYNGRSNDEIILLDTWISRENKFLLGNNIFPDKVTDLQGKIIKLGAFTYNPYVILGHTYSTSYGIDIRLTQEFTKKHNATPILKVDKSEKWGMQYNDVSKPTGLLAELYYHDVDIVLGGYLHIKHSYHYLDFTKSHYSSRLYALVPKAKLVSEITLPLCPFNWIVWLMVLISFIGTSSILYVTIYSKDRRYLFGEVAMLIYGIYVQQSNYLPAITKIYKKIVIWAFIMGVYISIIYNSRMTSLMTVPRYEKPISTIQDLIESNIKIGCTAVIDYLLLLVNSDSKTDQNILSHFIEYNWSEIVQFTDKGEIGTLTETTQSTNYAINAVSKKGLSQLQIMGESLCFYHLLLCTKKNFPLLSAINKFVSRVIESGLTHFWENEAIYLHSNITMQNMIRFSTNHEPVIRRLGLDQVAGAFLMLLCGIFLSCLVFLYEILTFHNSVS